MNAEWLRIHFESCGHIPLTSQAYVEKMVMLCWTAEMTEWRRFTLGTYEMVSWKV